MRIININLRGLHKRKSFYLYLSLALILAFGVYFYKNALSFDANHDRFVNVEESILIASADPAMPEGGVREKGYHVHVNLDTKQLYVYKDGQFVKSYPCSGGKTTTPSPEGTWKIINKDTWGEGFGGAWMGFNVPWGKYGIHGTVYPWTIGKSNASEGCIRMLNKDVRELYSYIPYGTTVTIVHENRSFRTMKSGDIGSDVKELQANLKKLGYYKGSPDGKFGNYLKSALEKFQKDNKIYTSGRADKKTVELLKQKVLEFEGSTQIN